MLFIPVDLFTPWINQRENAINANWNDMLRSNQVQQGWLQNDAQQYRNWLTRDTFNDNVALSNARARQGVNAAETSDMNLRLAQIGQPGAEALANFGSDWLVQSTAANQPNIPTIAQNAANVTLANSAADVARANATRQYAPVIYDAQGQYAANRARANVQLLPSQVAAEEALLGAQASQNAYAQNNYNYGNNANLFPQFQAVQNPQGLQGQPQPGGANPTNMFVPNSVIPTVQPQIPNSVPTDVQAVQGVLSRLNVGAQVQIPLPAGGIVIGGRDDQGLYIIQNNQKVYLQQPTYAPRGDALDWNLPQPRAQLVAPTTQNAYGYVDLTTGAFSTNLLPAD